MDYRTMGVLLPKGVLRDDPANRPSLGPALEMARQAVDKVKQTRQHGTVGDDERFARCGKAEGDVRVIKVPMAIRTGPRTRCMVYADASTRLPWGVSQ
jgi:hypothetical protein